VTCSNSELLSKLWINSTFGSTPWRGISPSQGPYHRTTVQQRTKIHALSGIKSHGPSIQAGKTHALDRAATGTDWWLLGMKTKGTVEWLSLLIRIKEVSDSNFGLETGYPYWILSWFFSVSPGTAMIVSEVRPPPLPFTSLPIHHLPVILFFDGI
jgi:hypothetical protein